LAEPPVDRALELPRMEDDGHEVRAEARKDERTAESRRWLLGRWEVASAGRRRVASAGLRTEAAEDGGRWPGTTSGGEEDERSGVGRGG